MRYKDSRTKKYRPSLTSEQILYILKLAKSKMPMTTEDFSIIATLAPFQAKIENDAITPASVAVEATPKPSLLESLGGEPAPTIPAIPSDTFPNDLSIPAPETKLPATTKEQLWAESYAKYSISPESCSLIEIQEAMEHMYLNDLMTPEQIAEFEANSITIGEDKSNG